MRKLLIALGVLIIASTARADLLLAYNTFGNLGTESNEPAASVNANLTASDMTAVGITFAANGNRYGGTSWASNPVVASDNYITWTINATAGFTFSVTNMIFLWDRSATGPSNLALRSSIDSFASDIFTSLAMPAALAGRTNTISGITDVTSIEFRFYGSGAAAAGSGGFDTTANANNIIFNGTTASAIPEPSSLALFGVAACAGYLARRKKRPI